MDRDDNNQDNNHNQGRRERGGPSNLHNQDQDMGGYSPRHNAREQRQSENSDQRFDEGNNNPNHGGVRGSGLLQEVVNEGIRGHKGFQHQMSGDNTHGIDHNISQHEAERNASENLQQRINQSRVNRRSGKEPVRSSTDTTFIKRRTAFYKKIPQTKDRTLTNKMQRTLVKKRRREFMEHVAGKVVNKDMNRREGIAGRTRSNKKNGENNPERMRIEKNGRMRIEKNGKGKQVLLVSGEDSEDNTSTEKGFVTIPDSDDTSGKNIKPSEEDSQFEPDEEEDEEEGATEGWKGGGDRSEEVESGEEVQSSRKFKKTKNKPVIIQEERGHPRAAIGK